MGKRDVVVIASSAGGVEALSVLFSGLPEDLAASLLIVQHVPAEHHSVLPLVLSKAGRLPVSHPEDGQRFLPGHAYVAPPDHHLLLEGPVMRVERGPRENGHRPAADALFRTAARAKGPGVIGIVLTGALDDGAAGLFAVKQRGGLTVVQDPNEAYCPDMPRAAMEYTQVDAVATIREIAEQLPDWTRETVPDEAPPTPPLLEAEARIELEGPSGKTSPPGQPSVFSCPDCGGVLNEIEEGPLIRFRCQVGHGFNPASLQEAQADDLEAALWAALRALKQQAELARRLMNRAAQIKQPKSASWHGERASTAEKQAELIRQVLSAGSRRPR